MKLNVIIIDKGDELNSMLSKKNASKKNSKEENNEFPSYPHYPVKDDIYNREKEEDIEPEFPYRKKVTDEEAGDITELNYNDVDSEGDLDVPGSELDNEQEEIGSEDEENNYYSIGGDNHNNLEENKGRIYN